ncbi:MAG: FkbM family methyltransferase [Alphaproteobacteria bacterium]
MRSYSETIEGAANGMSGHCHKGKKPMISGFDGCDAQAHSALIREKNCRHGLMYYIGTDSYIGRSLEMYGEFSEIEIDLLCRLMRPGAYIVDAGANIGTHTLPFAKASGPDGAVLAFEPQQVLFQILRENVARNGITNVRTFPQALGSTWSRIALPVIDYSYNNNFGGVSLRQEGDIFVQTITLDSLSLGRCDLLKVDVEGMEADVLTGGQVTIERTRPVLYVENDRRLQSPALISLIMSFGYQLWWHTPPLYNENNFSGCSVDVFPGTVSINMLCLPNEARAFSCRASITGMAEIV